MEKITIKEAGRYANFLDRSISLLSTLVYHGLNSKLIEVVETHKKSMSYKEAEDEIINVEFEDDIDIDIDVLNNIINELVEEKVTLANAIAEAKKNVSIKVDEDKSINLDSSIEYAKILRRISDEFYRPLISKKENKVKEQKKAYAFNVEGNQTPYYYEAEIETVLKYDKNEFIKKDKLNKMLADKISEKIEKAMSSDIVDFKPKYSYLDSIEDIVNKHIGA